MFFYLKMKRFANVNDINETTKQSNLVIRNYDINKTLVNNNF